MSNLTHEYAHLPPHHGYDSWLGLPFTNMHFCKDPDHPPKLGFCMVMANNTIVEQPTQYDNLTARLTTHAMDFITGACRPWRRR